MGARSNSPKLLEKGGETYMKRLMTLVLVALLMTAMMAMIAIPALAQEIGAGRNGIQNAEAHGAPVHVVCAFTSPECFLIHPGGH
jgi:hypothetical protein